MIGPLSLANVMTVIFAVLCLWTIAPQARGNAVKVWRLAMPASCAAVDALILLAGTYQTTLETDAEWLAAVAIGAVLGRMKGWAMTIEVDHMHGLVRQYRAGDGLLAGLALLVLAMTDFIAAAQDEALIEPQHIAAAAAFCAGYLACRAISIAVRTTRLPHVELHRA